MVLRSPNNTVPHRNAPRANIRMPKENAGCASGLTRLPTGLKLGPSEPKLIYLLLLSQCLDGWSSSELLRNPGSGLDSDGTAKPQL